MLWTCKGSKDALSTTRSDRLLDLFKAGLIALLAANTVWFFATGATSKGFDAAAWLALLTLFEIEARWIHRLHGRGARLALRTARLAAGAAVIASALGYVFEDNVLDAINSTTWVAVVLMLEFRVRYPHTVQRQRAIFRVLSAALYAALGLLVLVWAWRTEWFDAYDALLWLVAFVTLERKVADKDHFVLRAQGDG
jgi:hypothetical protein